MPLLPLALFALASAPTFPNEQLRQVFFAESKGTIHWRVQEINSAWAKNALAKINWPSYSLESVIQLTENSVRAWHPNGDPHPDFEGHLRLKLKNVDNVRVPIVLGKKNRFAVLNWPNYSPPEVKGESISIGLEGNEIGMLPLLANDSGKVDSHFQFISISADPADKFVSIPVRIDLHGHTQPLEPKVNSEFSLAGNRYAFAQVRAFSDGDIGPSIPGTLKLPYHTTIILKKIEQVSPLAIAGVVETPATFDEKTNIRWRVDKRGNFVRLAPDDELVSDSGHFSTYFQRGFEDERTIRLVTSVNLKSIKTVTFRAYQTTTAWLENVPLDPNQTNR